MHIHVHRETTHVHVQHEPVHIFTTRDLDVPQEKQTF